jgi:hypothetical protein
MLFDLYAPERCWDVTARVVAVTQQFGYPWDEVPHGWKTICIIEFPAGVPEVIDALPVVDAWHMSHHRIGMCQKSAYPAITRHRAIELKQGDATHKRTSM